MSDNLSQRTYQRLIDIPGSALMGQQKCDGCGWEYSKDDLELIDVETDLLWICDSCKPQVIP